MAEEKTLVINLRRDALKTPKHRRSRDAMSILRRRVAKFSKSGKVKIDPKTSERIWSRGAKNPHMRIRIKVRKLDDGSVETELVG